MASKRSGRLGKRGAAALAKRLTEFAATLSPSARHFVGEILVHAAVVDGEVQGGQAQSLAEFLQDLAAAYATESQPPQEPPDGTIFDGIFSEGY